MLHFLSKWILKLCGWKTQNFAPADIKKGIIVVAPHTSNRDYVIGRLGFFVLKIKVKFLIKKEIFIFPIGYLIKLWGGIPIDRKRDNRMVHYLADLFRQNKSMFVVITPEGTRKYNEHWHKGFYYIALKAGVPIILGYLNYAKKESGLGIVIEPSGDYQKDLAIIQDYYRDKTARYPEKFNLSPKIDKKSTVDS